MSPLLVSLALSLPADAGQVAPATAYEGAYDLWCEQASLHLDIGLSIAVGDRSGSWGDVFTLPLACSMDVADLAAEVDAVEAGCLGAGGDEALCMDLADDLFQTLLPFTEVGETTMPTGMTVDVYASDWWSRWTGVYTARIRHDFADGRTAYANYWLDNRVGYQEGRFVTFGLALGESGASGDFGCAVTTAAAIDGRIRRLDGYDLSATFGINQSLSCVAANQDGIGLATIGLSFEGAMAGAKVP